MRGRPYLVVKKSSHISLSVGFMLLVLQPISSISRVSGARKHSSRRRTAGVRMPEKSEDGWVEWHWAYLAISSAYSFWSTLSQQPHFLNHQSENDLCLPMHLLYPIISKLSDIWGDTLKPVFKLRCPWWWGNYCARTFQPQPNVTLYFQQKAQSVTVAF